MQRIGTPARRRLCASLACRRSLVAHCRAGFEPEAAADLGRPRCRRPAIGSTSMRRAGRGFVVGRLDRFDSRHWPQRLAALAANFRPLALLRQWTAPAHRRCRDSVAAPIASHRSLSCSRRFAPNSRCPDSPGRARTRDLWIAAARRLRTPTMARSCRDSPGRSRRDSRPHCANAGVLCLPDEGPATAPGANLHALFIDGANAFVGASVSPWASRWTMGIPRLRMPGGAPSRSTLKLAEAFVTFLGDREADLLRAGMRAVDLGAAPGGWTWQLARRGLRVTAVDNGPLKGDVGTIRSSRICAPMVSRTCRSARSTGWCATSSSSRRASPRSWRAGSAKVTRAARSST